MKPQSAYDELARRSRERRMLASCMELLGWDELTYMPRGGVADRGEQLALLWGLYYDASTAPPIGEMLQQVAESPMVSDPESVAAVNVREWQRSYGRLTKLPRKLVEELATVTTTAQQAWAAARLDSDYSQFQPWLERIVSLKQNEAECLGHDGDPFDALLQDYEPDIKTSELAATCAALRSELVALLDAIQGAKRPAKSSILQREYPNDRQRIFIETIAGELGFDFERGRIDTTTHPFYSSIGSGDIRITTRYNQYDLGDALFSSLHEIGHALYEQGVDPQHHGTPMGEAMWMGVHESQSRLWEKFIGQSRPFWANFFPRARELFHDALHDVTLDEFYREVNQVRPGWNRVRADALTYDLHIMVRFELERDLISGSLPPAELPGAWNEKYHQYLGIIPSSDKEGCLQDGHWAAGQFGYFPVYTLGNICAAQLHAAVRRDVPDLDEQIESGDFTCLLQWLRNGIYQHGQRYSSNELMQRVTGESPNSRFLVNALRGISSELYGI